jgi:hypothetical protein
MSRTEINLKYCKEIPGGQRYLAVAINGSHSNPDLQEEISHILTGVNIYNQPLHHKSEPVDDTFYRLYQTSLIVICTSGQGKIQLEALETIKCGTLLFDTNNYVIQKYFTPNKEFIPYKPWWNTSMPHAAKRRLQDNLVAQLRFFLKYDFDATTIANNGRKKIDDLIDQGMIPVI